MAYQQLAEHLKNNLKDLYRQALDADARLDGINKEGLGHHDAILQADAGFRCEAKRFMPYVQELSEDIEALMRRSEAGSEQQIQQLVKKLKTLHTTLAEFKLAMKG